MRNGSSPENPLTDSGTTGSESVDKSLIGQLDAAEDRIAELEKRNDRHERIVAKERRDAIAETTRAGQNQLSHRFGKQLLRALKNPLFLILLPVNLVREWIAFRNTSRSPKVATSVDASRPKEAKKTREPISDELVRKLPVDGLAELTDRRLSRHIREANQNGDPEWAARLAAARWLKYREPGAAFALRRKRGQLVELDTSWLPPLRSKRLADVKEDTVFHIFKTLYPLESSGGAVRNWSVVTHQRAIGLRPIAAVTPGRLTHDITEQYGGKDGLFATQNGGVEVWYCQLANIERAKIPRDTLLTFDTHLLARIADQTQPSLIHATSGFQGYDNALKGIALAKSRNLPFVYEVRSFHEHTWRNMIEGILELPMTKLRAEQENRCMAEADAVVTISEAMAKELETRGIDRDRLFIVPNSIDEHFLAVPDPKAVASFRDRWHLTDYCVIGYISNISQREGHDVLCRGFAEINAQRPETRLLIVGDGPQKVELERLVDELGIADAVIFTGTVDHAKIVEAYAAIDVFVIPRLQDYASDFVTPMKPIEAMAIGCSLVMSDRPVSREILGDEERGLFFNTGDAADLARVVESIFTDQLSAKTRAQRARKWVEDHRRWPDNVRQYKEIYAAARARHQRRKTAP